MRDYANPLLLFVITALFAWCMAGGTESESALLQPGLWLLTVCATGCIVNALLCLARALARRPVLAGVVWSMVHLVLGCGAWVWLAQDEGTDRETLAKYRDRIADHRLSPYVADEAGDSTLSLAAALGKDAVVRRLLASHPHGEAEQAALLHAAWCAAQNGQDAPLRRLLEAGVSARAEYADAPLLITAVNSGKVKAVSALLAAGAEVNAPDAEGNTALMHAVVNGHYAMVKLLLEQGADPALTNRAGRRAADGTAHSAILELLEGKRDKS